VVCHAGDGAALGRRGHNGPAARAQRRASALAPGADGHRRHRCTDCHLQNLNPKA